MSSREDTSQKAKKRHRSRSPGRASEKRGERHRSRSNDRSDKKKSDRHRSRSPERGGEKTSDRQRSSRPKSRSRSKSRERTSSIRSRDKDRESNTHRGRDVERKSTSIVETNSRPIAPVAAKAPAKLEKDREAQKEEEQAVLDDEMRKRRERVKAWQEEKTKRIAAETAAAANLGDSSTLRSATGSDECQDGGAIDTGDGNSSNALNGGTEGFSATSPNAGWNLEDDDDDGKAEEVSGDADDAEMVLPSFSTSSVSNSDTGAFQNLNHADSRLNKKTRKERSNSISITAIGSPKLDSADQSRGASKIQVSADSVAPSLSPTVLLKSGDTPVDMNVKGPILGEVGGSLNAMDEGGVNGGDYDPLDDFMSGLYSGGELEEQRSLPSDVSQPMVLSSSDDKAALQSDVAKTSLSFGKIVDDSMALVSSESKGEGEGEVEGGGEENEATATETNTLPDDDYDEYTFLAGDNPTLNPFGSNFITLDQIMGNKTSESVHRDTTSSSSSGGNARRAAIIGAEYANSGWESDSAPPSPMHSSSSKDYRHGINSGRQGETEEEREEREDKDRKEFIDAIRAARAAEDVVRERSRQKDDAIEKSKEQLGRVFAGEGDVMDETDIEEKKKSALEILEDSKKGKELKPVDHKTVDYIPFRKNLYIVPRALSRLTEDDLNEKREDLQIKVRGKGCPAPVDTWGQCGLSERVLGVLERLGLQAPFAIQKQAIPAIMCGRDLIGVAKTGSGKTLAFLLPMFRHIMDQPPLRDQEGPIGLVMAPARELAFQIFNEAKKFSKALGIRVACVYGGAGVADQIADLKRGAEIVVCTPGRMIDILCMQAGKLVNLKRVTMVVLDEADRCFDMGFAPQIEMVLQNIRPDRQTVLFSATFPKQIEKLAKTVLRLPLEVVVGERSSVNKDITQVVEVHEDADKFMRLLQLLGVWYEKGSALIFVDTQEKCDQLFHDLLKSGYPCLSLHGGKDQLDRDHTLHEFKKGIKTVMVATSVAGRGLDVPDIVVVVNYNCPNHIEDYVHRVGRTGRAGRKGTAYTFISPSEEQYSPLMIKALEKAGQEPAPELLEMVNGFKEKVSRGEARYSSSGFDGKGFTFDASEMSETQKNNNLQRKAYDVEQGIDEKGEDEEEEVDDVEKPVTGSSGAVVAAAVETTPLDRARAIATSLCLSKGLPVPSVIPVPPPPTSAPPASVALGADGKVDSRAAMHRAKLIASQLASGGKLGEGTGEVKDAALHFSEEIDINDYPPQARRKVTHKNALDDISERTGVAIISRGAYIPPGKKLEVGDRRLYLLLEGNTDLQVRQAKLEILRLLDEETLRLGASGSASSFGRYAVL